MVDPIFPGAPTAVDTAPKRGTLNHLRLTVSDIPRAEAIKWITANPAKAMGIADKTGSLEPGKAADIVVWSRDPFSVYAQAEKVFIDGALVYDRKDARFQPKSDFELGQPGQGAFN